MLILQVYKLKHKPSIGAAGEFPRQWKGKDKPTGRIENPVINSPFAPPARHFRFGDEGITGEIVETRRVSSYFVPVTQPRKKVKGQLAFGSEWTQDRLQENAFINQVRERVALWRRGGYPGVTPVTRRLLDYWQRPDRQRRLFFCQIEALETAIYITEVAGRYGDSWIENSLRQRVSAGKLTRALLRPEAGAFSETPDQMVRRVCRELGGKKNIVAINDEAHHCYRRKPAEDPDRLSGDDIGAPVVHTHAGSDIITGVIAEACISQALARDAEIPDLVAAAGYITRTAANAAYAPSAHQHAGNDITSAGPTATAALTAAMALSTTQSAWAT